MDNIITIPYSGTDALAWDDYIKISNAKDGDVITLEDGKEYLIQDRKNKEYRYKVHYGSTKNMNLDYYDGTYVG